MAWCFVTCDPFSMGELYSISPQVTHFMYTGDAWDAGRILGSGITANVIEMRRWARFLSLAWSELRLCGANHRAGYFSNLACDWLSIVWAYSEQETENGPWSMARNVTIVPLDLRFQHKKCIHYSHSLPHNICTWFWFDLFCGGNSSCRLMWYIYLTIYFQCCFISDEAIVWLWLPFWRKCCFETPQYKLTVAYWHHVAS